MTAGDVNTVLIAKRFYESLPKYSRDKEVSKRLQDAVSSAIRNSCYDLRVDFSKETFKKHLLAAFVDARIFDKIRRDRRRLENCFRVVDQVVDDLFSELKCLKGEDKWRFLENIIKLHVVRRRLGSEWSQ